MADAPPPMEIRGGAGPAEVAAIVAAVTWVLAEETAVASAPPERKEQGRWVLAGRTRPAQRPVAVDTGPIDPWGNLRPRAKDDA